MYKVLKHTCLAFELTLMLFQFIISPPYRSKQHMAVCGLSLHLGGSESRKTLEEKFILQIGTLNPYGNNERFSSFHEVI